MKPLFILLWVLPLAHAAQTLSYKVLDRCGCTAIVSAISACQDLVSWPQAHDPTYAARDDNRTQDCFCGRSDSWTASLAGCTDCLAAAHRPGDRDTNFFRHLYSTIKGAAAECASGVPFRGRIAGGSEAMCWLVANTADEYVCPHVCAYHPQDHAWTCAGFSKQDYDRGVGSSSRNTDANTNSVQSSNEITSYATITTVRSGAAPAGKPIVRSGVLQECGCTGFVDAVIGGQTLPDIYAPANGTAVYDHLCAEGWEQAGWKECASCVVGRKVDNSTESGFYMGFAQTVENALTVCGSGSATTARDNVKVDRWDSTLCAWTYRQDWACAGFKPDINSGYARFQKAGWDDRGIGSAEVDFGATVSVVEDKDAVAAAATSTKSAVSQSSHKSESSGRNGLALSAVGAAAAGFWIVQV